MSVKSTFMTGLFGKTPKQQEIKTETAVQIVAEAMIKGLGYGTIRRNCTGIYTHKDGTTVIEPSIKIKLEINTDEPLAKKYETNSCKSG